MDATGASPERFKAAIELFLEGHPLGYEDVLFSTTRERALHVQSFSDWAPENATAEMARETIARARAVLAELMERSPEFARAVSKLSHEHYFCWDYGQGSIALAREIAGKFEWLGAK